MDLNNIKISIVMPCFNRLDLLEKSIKSILNQTYKNFEFIIVDDCSDLETIILLKKYRDFDPRIKVFFNKKNRGPTYSFNKGLYFAREKIIARMDSDDISHPNRFEKQVKFLKKNPTVFIVGTAVNLINEKDEKIRSLFLKKDREGIIESLKYSNPLINSTYMANTNIQNKKLLYLKESFYPADDYYCWYNIIKKNYILTNMSDILLDYREHESESFKHSRVQGLKTLLVQKLFLIKKKRLFSSKIINSKSVNEIKSLFKEFPNQAKPSKIEILYYEFNNTVEFFKERKWYLLILKYFFNIRSLKDFYLYYLFMRHLLSIYKNSLLKSIKIL